MTGKSKACSLAFVCAMAAALAQQLGMVTGVVTDPAGSVIPNASVRLNSSETGYDRMSTTDIQGRYTFPAVPAGAYALTIESPGFRSYVLKFAVSTSNPFHANVQMEIASVAETVEVTAAAGVLSTQSASYSMQVQGRRVREERPRIAARGIRGRGGKFNTEEYDSFEENIFTEAKRNPLSTFSADVDTASYSNTRRFLREGRLPPPDSVRIEELINYFTYDYPEPGNEHPFSTTASMAACPWNPKHKLLHIGLRAKSVDVTHLPPSNLVFLIDVSGSMNESNKLPLVQQSLRLLVQQLREQDRVSIAVYAGAAGLVLAPTPGNDKARILGAIDALRPGGSTAGALGIRLAYQLARDSFLAEGNNRVILATDGDFNVGVSSDGELIRLVEKERTSGVFLSVLGFGMGNLKDSKMEKIADHGNGNYAYIDSLQEARKVLVDQLAGTLLTVAKDVKFQVEFNPARVRAYRLIGYENRILRAEEFNDDKKDAGDLGAGTAVTVLYELIPAGSREELASVDDLRHQRVGTSSAAGSRESAYLKFRYKPPAAEKSILFQQPVTDSNTAFADAPPEMRFAAAVAEFGLLLRRSKFRDSSSFDHVLTVVRQARGTDTSGYRAEFLDLVKLANTLDRREEE